MTDKRPQSEVVDLTGNDTDIERTTETSKSCKLSQYFFGSTPSDLRERKYVRKLDIWLFSYVMLGYFIKYLDQINTNNAYVSGMKEDLNLYGNERNLLTTYFNIGIIVGTVPAQIIQLKYVRPSIWMPSCELAWSILVMAMASAKNVETLYALRFFIGLLETCSFPGYAALLSSWYGPGQLGKRVALFENSQAIAAMFSGYLQAGVYNSLNGKAGLAGWKWLFIFDAIISIPIAVYGYWAIPDQPTNTRAFYLNKEDREYGLQRMERLKRATPKPLTWKSLKEIYFSKTIWIFIFPYLMVAEAGLGVQFFNLWLKAKNFSVTLVNVVPTAGYAIQLLSSLLFGTIADATGKRLHTVIAVSLIVIAANIMLSIWHIPVAALWVAFFISNVSSAAQPIIISWGHEITQYNAELRQLLVATGNIFTYTCSATLPLGLFPTYDAPHYKYGYQVSVMFGVLGIIGSFGLYFLHKHQIRNQNSQLTDQGDAVSSSGDRECE